MDCKIAIILLLMDDIMIHPRLFHRVRKYRQVELEGFISFQILALYGLTFPELSRQQIRGSVFNNKNSNNGPQRTKEPSNWKTILIIVLGVIFFAAVIYGSNCYHIIKMHFFERTEKKYMKMNNLDSCSHV